VAFEGEELPASQSVQEVAPSAAFAIVPGEQSTQTEAPLDERVPERQVRHASEELEPVALFDVPDAHSLHRGAPSREYLPTAQSWQRSPEELAVPPGQKEHSAEFGVEELPASQVAHEALPRAE